MPCVEFLNEKPNAPKVDRRCGGGGGVWLAVLEDGAYVAVCLASRLEVREVAEGAPGTVVVVAEHIAARTMAIDGDCIYVCCAGDNAVMRHTWLRAEGRLETTRLPSLHRSPLRCFVRARDGDSISIAEDGTVGLWNGRCESVAVVDSPRSSRITSCAIDGATVYLGTKTGDVLCCTVRGGSHLQFVGQLGPAHERGPVRQLVLVGQRLVSGEAADAFDRARGEECSVPSVKLTNSHSLAVGASDTRIFDLLTFECVARLSSDDRRAQHDGFHCVCINTARTLRAAAGRTVLNFSEAVGKTMRCLFVLGAVIHITVCIHRARICVPRWRSCVLCNFEVRAENRFLCSRTLTRLLAQMKTGHFHLL